MNKKEEKIQRQKHTHTHTQINLTKQKWHYQMRTIFVVIEWMNEWTFALAQSWIYLLIIDARVRADCVPKWIFKQQQRPTNKQKKKNENANKWISSGIHTQKQNENQVKQTHAKSNSAYTQICWYQKLNTKDDILRIHLAECAFSAIVIHLN